MKFIDIKWHIMGKFLNIGAVTIVNNRDHTLHCVKLRYVTVFDGVHPVLLCTRMSRYVTVITVNNRDHTLHCVKLRYVTVFDGVHPVLLCTRMSRYVTVITAREVYRYKMAYHGEVPSYWSSHYSEQ